MDLRPEQQEAIEAATDYIEKNEPVFMIKGLLDIIDELRRDNERLHKEIGRLNVKINTNGGNAASTVYSGAGGSVAWGGHGGAQGEGGGHCGITGPHDKCNTEGASGGSYKDDVVVLTVGEATVVCGTCKWTGAASGLLRQEKRFFSHIKYYHICPKCNAEFTAFSRTEFAPGEK